MALDVPALTEPFKRSDPLHSNPSRLRTVKLLHTLIWAFFAGCILAMPVMAGAGRFTEAFALAAIVLVEVLVLLLNDWRCPLTGVAARYTEERQDNFDIYLPRWLARHNKAVFGSLYVAGLVFSVVMWLQ